MATSIGYGRELFQRTDGRGAGVWVKREGRVEASGQFRGSSVTTSLLCGSLCIAIEAYGLTDEVVLWKFGCRKECADFGKYDFFRGFRSQYAHCTVR